ncbi:MAG: hypothetical protein EAZ95_15795 [Bacteroidetes bacterium]|nr:MAG: hypothetical protein EAZ95_15795 [Bacteroidota bacterium]
MLHSNCRGLCPHKPLTEWAVKKKFYAVWFVSLQTTGKENQDYFILHIFVKNKISKSNPTDYALTLDCAKQITMVQRGEKGNQARQNFIECEKQLQSIQQTLQTCLQKK